MDGAFYIWPAAKSLLETLLIEFRSHVEDFAVVELAGVVVGCWRFRVAFLSGREHAPGQLNGLWGEVMSTERPNMDEGIRQGGREGCKERKISYIDINICT